MKRSSSLKAESQGIAQGSQLSHSSPALVLASASPRRRELLGVLGARFAIVAGRFNSFIVSSLIEVVAALPSCPVPLATHPTLLAWRKADAACAEAPTSVIIGADTIVVLDGDVLGKPRDPDHARAMLRRLSGRMHTVYTGLAVIQPERRDRRFETRASAPDPLSPISNLSLDLVASDVVFAELSDAQIDAYVATGEPMDKAGAYGIQGQGGQLVRAVRGSYTCVVGLPIETAHRQLASAGVIGLNNPAEAYVRWLEAQGKEPLPCPPTFP